MDKHFCNVLSGLLSQSPEIYSSVLSPILIKAGREETNPSSTQETDTVHLVCFEIFLFSAFPYQSKSALCTILLLE